MVNRRIARPVLFVLLTIAFIFGGHWFYRYAIFLQNQTQLADLAQRSIIRTELAADLAVTVMAELQTTGLTGCSGETATALQNYVLSTGSIKNIHLLTAGRSCSGFTLNQAPARRTANVDWVAAANRQFRFAVPSKSEKGAFSILWQGDDYQLISDVSTGGLLFDLVPSALRDSLMIEVELNNGDGIASYGSNAGKPATTNDGDSARFSAASNRYPIRARLSLDRQALWAWSQPGSLLLEGVICLLALVIGYAASRLLLPPPSPIDEIDEGIENGEFLPYYQPIVALGSGQITGFEMLARWRKPSGEMVSPGRFIPLIENFGRADAMLFALLRRAGRELGTRLRSDEKLKLTFNITPDQFIDESFLPRLLEVFGEAGLPVENMVAEITERQQLSDIEQAVATVKRYGAAGLRVAIDDAGTGHNGLSSIQKLDVSFLKLDKIFIDGIVENERSRQMIEMLAQLAASYRMTVVAEGIESAEQAAAALSLGLHEGQGYYFSRPLPNDSLPELLQGAQLPATADSPERYAA